MSEMTSRADIQVAARVLWQTAGRGCRSAPRCPVYSVHFLTTSFQTPTSYYQRCAILVIRVIVYFHLRLISVSKAAKAEIRRARKQFERKLAQNIKSDSKSFAYARSKTKSKVQVGPLLDNNDVLLDSEKDKTSSLNNYFAAVFTSEDTTDIPIPTAMTSSDYMQDVHFSVEDVMSLLSKLRIDKAGGNDELSPRLLLELKDYSLSSVLAVSQKPRHRSCTG